MTIHYNLKETKEIELLKNYKCRICDNILDNYEKVFLLCKYGCLRINITAVGEILDITYSILNNKKKIHYTLYAARIEEFKIYLHDLTNFKWYNNVSKNYFNILSLSKKDIFNIINLHEKVKILK